MNKFVHAITSSLDIAVIAEYKRASPSLGDINLTVTLEEAVQNYQTNDATCLSILTEPIKFKGELDFIRRAKAVSSLPILRKDFITQLNQIEESKQAGADAILLIAAHLGDQELKEFITLAHRFELATLLEIHTLTELQKALRLNSDMIGVNSRNLKTLDIDLSVFDQFIDQIPDGVVVIAESGLTLADLPRLKALGFDGALIGTYFMQRL